MIVNIARPCDAEIVLFLNVREAQVIEQALFLADRGEGNDFQNDANTIGSEMENEMDEHDIPTLPAGTK